MNDTNTPITDIFINPRTKSFCQYQINRTDESHAMKYKEMYTFLTSLVPEKSAEINKLLFGLKSFVLLIEEKKIIELTPNLDPKSIYKGIYSVKRVEKQVKAKNKKSNKPKLFNF